MNTYSSRSCDGIVAANSRAALQIAPAVEEHEQAQQVARPYGLGGREDAVQQAFRTHYGQNLTTIYAPEIKLRERWLWAWADAVHRLDNLPPFWTVFALTLTETVGATVLALPIAVAQVGPLFGVLQIIILGLVNVLTIAALSEAITRSRRVKMTRFSLSFTGSLPHTCGLAHCCSRK